MSDVTEPVRLESLLAETAWLRALARRLCSDPGGADDLVQETWLTALEHPPRGTSGRAWLASVVRNLARGRGRSGAARVQREWSVARAEASESAADVVARAELSRKLAGHVLALEEPYRSTVLSRWFDGLSAEEIAQREGVNQSTVRTRLERGLAKLRERLERERGTGWMHAVAPLAFGGSAVSDAATTADAAAAAIGGMAMTTVAKVALACVGGLGLLWFSLAREPEAQRIDVAARDAEAAREVAGTDEREARVAASEVAPVVAGAGAPRADPAAPAASSETVPQGTIDGVVLRDGAPVAGGTVWHWPGQWRSIPDDPSAYLPLAPGEAIAAAPIAADGRFHLAPLQDGWHTLGVDLGRGVAVETIASVPATLEITVALGTATLAGRVFDEEGRPVAGAAVRVLREVGRQGFEHSARTGEDGAYAIRELPAEAKFVSLDRSGGRGAQAAHDVIERLDPPLAGGELRRLDFGLPSPMTRWKGRVVTRSGALVELGGRIGHRNLSDQSYGEIELVRGQPFELRLRPGKYLLQAMLHTSQAGPGTGALLLGTQEVGEHELVQDLVLPGTRIEGRVLDWNAPAGSESQFVSLHSRDGEPHQTAAVAEDGRFRFEAIPAHAWLVRGHPLPVPDGEASITVLAGDYELPMEVRLAKP